MLFSFFFVNRNAFAQFYFFTRPKYPYLYLFLNVVGQYTPSSRIPDVAGRWWRHADAATTVSSLPPLVAVAAVIAVLEDDRARPPQASAGSDWFDRGRQSGRCGSEENIVDRDGPTPRASSAAAAIAAPEGDRALPP